MYIAFLAPALSQYFMTKNYTVMSCQLELYFETILQSLAIIRH